MTLITIPKTFERTKNDNGEKRTNEPNQSVENGGVLFIKEATERNEFFEKNKQTEIYDEQSRTNKAKDLQSQERTDLGMNPVRWQRLVYHCANRTI